jgi:hypothetical protein
MSDGNAYSPAKKRIRKISSVPASRRLAFGVGDVQQQRLVFLGFEIETDATNVNCG